MKPFYLSIANKGVAEVINKRVGIRRPVKFLFFKYKNKERIIAYTVLLKNTAGENEFEFFKVKNSGEWLRGALKNGEPVVLENEKIVSKAIKAAIDAYETTKGERAYLELF
ncbi:MAG: hypothetical protein M9933_18320 [Chitinophagaceae bacterium]|nr:hypothetical protein [Chitinophagaceae bacterium]